MFFAFCYQLYVLWLPTSAVQNSKNNNNNNNNNNNQHNSHQTNGKNPNGLHKQGVSQKSMVPLHFPKIIVEVPEQDIEHLPEFQGMPLESPRSLEPSDSN